MIQRGDIRGYSRCCQALKCVFHCADEGSFEDTVRSLVRVEDVELLSALYSSGIDHEAIARGGLTTDDLERLALNARPEQCLLLCWSMCIKSYGCETPLAIEILVG